MKNRVTEILGIKYPILHGAAGGAAHIGSGHGGQAKLVAAVSSAGGLGTIHGLSAIRKGKKEVLDRVQKVKSLTNAPFSINVPISLPIIPPPRVAQLIEACIEAQMKIVTTAAGNPRLYTNVLHDAGIKVIHKVANVSHAVTAAEAGVDIIVATGNEAGGWQSREGVTTFCLVPQVIDAINGKVPVVAAGGVGDARGLVAAFALGAEGVLMGTRFFASIEFEPRHEIDKELIIKANDRSTDILGYGTKNPARHWTEEFLKEHCPGHKRPKMGPGSGGQISGLIKEVLNVNEIMHLMIDGTREELIRINKQLS